MSGSEIFIMTLLGIGSGCLVNTGFMLQLARTYWIRNQTKPIAFLLHVIGIAIGFSCGMLPIFVLYLIVMAPGWSWWRFAYFATVTLLAMAGSIAAFHNVAKALPPADPNECNRQ